jgi:hypothetical protein
MSEMAVSAEAPPAPAADEAPYAIRPITVDEYHRMLDVGILYEKEPVELVGGQLIAMPSEGPLHAAVVSSWYDRGRKLSAYVRAGIREYWMVDLVHRYVVVFSEPWRIFCRDGEGFAAPNISARSSVARRLRRRARGRRCRASVCRSRRSSP